MCTRKNVKRENKKEKKKSSSSGGGGGGWSAFAKGHTTQTQS
jgi:hypothetical protein